ncbi:ribosome maturation factor RimM [Caldibacillus lycopersici]|uniref:Ribosome maturation factor RimM n=1 Tax=Perspicuibacillus lycopersici TaxID=1325689 RepID=A0AAE3IRL5_9BACI|nr:ribosome maturation factor RimM [Perspicuibacillus lycopersici]MCU9612126.1 ribosome maturation factor RimM [Perspicuibacillus lycopersici]
MKRYFNVGKIVNTHGIKGEVRVISSTDFPDERYKKGSELTLFFLNGKQPITLKVNNWRKHKNFDLLTFDGYESLNDVEAFKGGLLKVSEDQLEELDSDEFYFHEIIGCTVKNMDGETIGVIKEILTPGANDVWVVKGTDRKEYYIPYIDEIVKEINVKDKIVWIEPMEGLF